VFAKKDQDILNAISLVNVAKKRMQELRSHGWNNVLEKVTSFCNKHGVEFLLWMVIMFLMEN
jgi:hypothetical protein